MRPIGKMIRQDSGVEAQMRYNARVGADREETHRQTHAHGEKDTCTQTHTKHRHTDPRTCILNEKGEKNTS